LVGNSDVPYPFAGDAEGNCYHLYDPQGRIIVNQIGDFQHMGFQDIVYNHENIVDELPYTVLYERRHD